MFVDDMDVAGRDVHGTQVCLALKCARHSGNNRSVYCLCGNLGTNQVCSPTKHIW